MAPKLQSRILERHWAQKPKYEQETPLLKVVNEILDELGEKTEEFREDIIGFFAERKDMDCDDLSAMSRKEFGKQMVAHCGKKQVQGLAGTLRKV